ncbi:hypothetical protein VUR80DRAFT_1420 [Thermomyces stellatus]
MPRPIVGNMRNFPQRRVPVLHPGTYSSRPMYFLGHLISALHASSTNTETSLISAADHPLAHHLSFTG